MPDYPSRSASYRLVSGILEFVAASCFLSDFSLRVLWFLTRSYYYNIGFGDWRFGGWLLACLALFAGLFALAGGVLALRRRKLKLVFVVHFVATSLALAIPVKAWGYFMEYSIEQSVLGLVLLALSTLLLMFSRSSQDESETQIFS